MSLSPSSKIVSFAVLALALRTPSALAQEPAPAPAPEPPAPAEPVPAEPAPVAAPAEAAPEPVAPAPPPVELSAPPPVLDAPPPVEEAAPAEDDLGKLSMSAWVRVDLGLSSATSAAPLNFPSGEKLDDAWSTGEFELHASGKVYKYASLTLNLAARYNSGDPGAPTMMGDFGVMDGIVQIEPSEYFNVWLGRMLVPVDRSNFSGPYFMAPWFYPGFGFAGGYVVVPRQGPFGRNDGVTVWGQIGGGMVKYYAGAFDLHNPGESPLFSGRLSLSLLNPEPGYYGSSTFHGQDLLGIGVGFQSKKDASVAPATAMLAPDDYGEFNFDVLFEKNFGSAGVLDIEGAYYKFNGDFESTDAGWFALASYILPGDVGGGRLQPLVRVQQAIPADDSLDKSLLLDAQIAFILNSYATRFTLGYRNSKAGEEKIQALFLGAQVQKF